MPHTARVLSILASSVCVGTLTLQVMAAAIAQPPPDLAPIINEDSPARIPGRYIVVFRQDTNPDVVVAAVDRIRVLGGTILFTYTRTSRGYAVSVPTEGPLAQSALGALRALEGVAYIEADRRGKFEMVQDNAPSGLDRIDQRLLGAPPTQLDTRFSYTETGMNVDVYVLDSGIQTTHTEFTGGRATLDWSYVADGIDDCSGHGTHMAGIIGGRTFGVAKNVRLHSVRVGEVYVDSDGITKCGPSLASVRSGVEWVTTHHIAQGTPAVANLSLSFPVTPGAPPPGVPSDLNAMELAIRDSIANGVTYVVSGGTTGDACNFSPSREALVISVGAANPFIDQDEADSWGGCLDLLAPSGLAESAQRNNGPYPGCTEVMPTLNSKVQACLGGTSTAAAYVTGCAALHLQNSPGDSPALVWARLRAVANVKGTPGMMDTSGWPGINNLTKGSPNVLLHCGALNDLMDDCRFLQLLASPFAAGNRPPPPGPQNFPVANWRTVC